MSIRSRTIVLPVLICGLLMVPVQAQAQRAFASGLPEPSGLLEPVTAAEASQNAQAQPKRSSSRAVITGALIGAGAALVFTGMAASRYGENEGGSFCGACMVQWSTFTVPIGAGIGAGIGWGIGRARRSVTAVPIFSRKSAGVVIAARF